MTFTVIVAPPGPADGVLAALQDWSGLGLLEEFLWIQPPRADGLPDMAVLRVASGRLTGATLNAALADYDGGPLQLCVLVPRFRGTVLISTELEQRVSAALERAANSPICRVRCVFTRPGGDAGRVSEPIAREGWHNVVLAADDAEGPDAVHLPLMPSTDPLDIGSHAAVGVAGLLGLWKDTPDGVLRDSRVNPGENLRLVQTYYRHLIATDVESNLRAAVTDTKDGLPRPRLRGASAVYVEDVSHATAGMAGELWARHEHLFRGPRVSPPKIGTTMVGPMEALRMFARFFWAALKNAPQSWYRAQVAAVSGGIARRVHGVVFGSSESAYTVVVKQITTDGLPVSWLDLGEAAGEIDRALADSEDDGPRSGAHADLSTLWNEYLSGALTLADGGERVAELPPVTLGVKLAVVRNVDDVVPTDRTDFRLPSGLIPATVGTDQVRAYDTLAVYNLEQRLVAKADTPGLEIEISRALADLRAWRAKAGDSYAVKVGNRFGKAILGTTQEVQGLLAQLREAAGSDDSQAAEAHQRRLGRRLRSILAISLIVLAALGTLAGMSVIDWTLGAILGVTLLVLAAILMVMTFGLGWRQLFQLINRGRSSEPLADSITANLRQAVRDLRTLSEAYGQFLEWSRVAAAFLAEPYPAGGLGRVRRLRLTGEFPRAVKIGEAEPNAAAIASVAAGLRKEVFTVGWLSPVWQELLGDAEHRLGPDAHDLKDAPTRMYGELSAATVGRESLLSRWVDLIVAEGPGLSGSDALWERVLSLLRGPPAAEVDRLLCSIRVLGTPDGRRTDLARFLNGVQQSDGQRRERFFDAALLSPRASTAGSARVDSVMSATRWDGLSRTDLVLEMGASIPAWEFRFSDDRPPSPEGIGRHSTADSISTSVPDADGLVF